MNNPKWVIKNVVPRKDYTLLLTFESGEQRVYDATPLLQNRIFSALRNPDFFLKATAMFDTVVWNDDIDIAPEHLYEYSLPV